MNNNTKRNRRLAHKAFAKQRQVTRQHNKAEKERRLMSILDRAAESLAAQGLITIERAV